MSLLHDLRNPLAYEFRKPCRSCLVQVGDVEELVIDYIQLTEVEHPDSSGLQFPLLVLESSDAASRDSGSSESERY